MQVWGAKISVLPANRRFLAVRTEFWHPTARTALSIGQVRGALIVACAQAGVQPVEYPAARVQAGRLWLRRGREGAGAGDGRGDPQTRREADPDPCRRCARGRDLPRDVSGAAATHRLVARPPTWGGYEAGGERFQYSVRTPGDLHFAGGTLGSAPTPFGPAAEPGGSGGLRLAVASGAASSLTRSAPASDHGHL